MSASAQAEALRQWATANVLRETEERCRLQHYQNEMATRNAGTGAPPRAAFVAGCPPPHTHTQSVRECA